MDPTADNLLSDVLLVRKTPKYDRLKDSDLINHPYIQGKLINNWLDATDTHFEVAQRFEDVLRERANKVTVIQEWPLRTKDTQGRSLVVSVGGDGTYLRTSSMIEDIKTPILGVNTDPGRSLGILCSKFLYKNRTRKVQINRIFD